LATQTFGPILFREQALSLGNNSFIAFCTGEKNEAGQNARRKLSLLDIAAAPELWVRVTSLVPGPCFRMPLSALLWRPRRLLFLGSPRLQRNFLKFATLNQAWVAPLFIQEQTHSWAN
jgi:hypothetical protein